ncbi:MAG TPA: allantoate amidohydrolase [Chthoniobacteraceae bacterium]|nr:allantoate amidohydrolase [Chthoniobacteraceae bacterium]
MSPSQRITTRLNELACCTDDAPRLTRTFLSPAMRRAHDLVAGWMRDAGLGVRIDAIGNVIGRLEGSAPLSSHQTLLLGSHLDTVRDAGRFDGALGVILAIECAAALHKRALPFALEVLAFSDEEGVRFQSTYLGSRAVAGTFDQRSLELRDAKGRTLAEAICAFGCDPSEIAAEARSPDDILGYLEVHIEQGPVLQERDLPVGIVTAIAGQTRAQATFRGIAGHAGTVPMTSRRDALCAAAEFILKVERLGSETPGLVATVGQITALPGASNVIPGVVDLTLDLRHQDDAIRRSACDALHAASMQLAHCREIGCDFAIIQESGSIPCDPELRRALADSLKARELPVFDLPSGAGHDAVALSALCPAAMLFVRSLNGISHHPDEFASESDIAVALDVLIRTIERLAGNRG